MKALVNYQIADEFAAKTGLDVVPIKSYGNLASPVSAHPDMLFCIIDRTVFCYQDYMLENNLCDVFREEGYDIVFVANICAPKYPKDVSLNVLVMGKYLICNTKYVASEILEYAEKNGYSICHVKQGYSACSTLVIDENTAVTSDMGIASAIEATGKKVICIDNDGIILPGYNCGFIGGASGKIGESVCFFGDICTLRDGKVILEQLAEKKKRVFPILSGSVYDFGGIKLL